MNNENGSSTETGSVTFTILPNVGILDSVTIIDPENGAARPVGEYTFTADTVGTGTQLSYSWAATPPASIVSTTGNTAVVNYGWADSLDDFIDQTVIVTVTSTDNGVITVDDDTTVQVQIPAPVIGSVEPKTNDTVIVGQPSNWYLKTTKGPNTGPSEVSTAQWSFVGSGGDPIVQNQGDTTPVITFPDAGAYEVNVALTWTNSAGTDTQTGASTQTVNPPGGNPISSVSIVDTDGVLGTPQTVGDYRFSVDVTGDSSNLTYEWEGNGAVTVLSGQNTQDAIIHFGWDSSDEMEVSTEPVTVTVTADGDTSNSVSDSEDVQTQRPAPNIGSVNIQTQAMVDDGYDGDPRATEPSYWKATSTTGIDSGPYEGTTYTWTVTPDDDGTVLTPVSEGSSDVWVTFAKGGDITLPDRQIYDLQATAVRYSSYGDSEPFTQSVSVSPAGPSYDGESISYTVIVETKDVQHPQFGYGSSQAYNVGGVQGREITMNLGDRLALLQGTSSNTGHRIRIYQTEEKGFEITNGVDFFGTEGSVGPPRGQTVFEPQLQGIYYYQCENHELMGGRINVNVPNP